jgi:dTDP-4-dehydrorhamnose 3,5-epimerase
VLYKVSAPYALEHERAIIWNDPDLAIDWPDPGVPPILSGRDKAAPPFRRFESPFTYEA